MNSDLAAEMLARTLAGSIDHSRIPGRSYGGLTSSDIAASLHAVSDRAGALFITTKYLGLVSDLNALERILLLRVAGIAKARNWWTKANTLGNLVLHALEETIPANKCTVCNGTKYLEATETTPMVVCAGCEGTGSRPDLSAHTRAKKLGISVAEFKTVYHRYLSDTIRLIQDIEAQALADIGGYLTER